MNPITFHDDRNKAKDTLTTDKILYEDKDICFCQTETKEKILFDKATGEVQSKKFQFWIAENLF